MNELIKRIITSVILIIILIFSFYNNAILILSLLLIFFQIYYEFLLIFRKIFHNRNKLILYSILFCILICLSILIFKIWLIIDSENTAKKIFLLFIISISICSDIGGYTFGKIFKGKKISKISPNKTYSGMIGSYILSLLFAYTLFNKYIYIDKIIIMSLLIATVTQAGDLLISYLKRKANIKDTGVVLPGHGGLLDRFDGIIFAIPFGLLINIFLWENKL